MADVVLTKAHSAQLRICEKEVKKEYERLLAHSRNQKPPDEKYMIEMMRMILVWAETFAVDRVTRPKKPKRILTIKQTYWLVVTLGEWLGVAITSKYDANMFVEKARPSYDWIVEHTH